MNLNDIDLEALLNGEKGSNKSASQKTGSSTKSNLAPGFTRTTVIIREEYLQKLKDLAWWGRARQSDVLDQILEKFFANNDAPPIPQGKRILSED